MVTYSCKKEKIKIDDINGNVISESENEQWSLSNLEAAEGDDYDILFGNDYPVSNYFSDHWIDLDDCNFNCTTENIFFDFRVYPNPVNYSETQNKIYLDLNTTLDISYYYFAVVKNGIIITRNGPSFNEIGDFFIPNYGKYFNYFYVFLTSAHCAFYGSGKIKVAK
jgi:hypothetical protein